MDGSLGSCAAEGTLDKMGDFRRKKEPSIMELFYASVYVWEHPEEHGLTWKEYKPEDMTRQYALKQQVTEGPNVGQRPWGLFAKKEDLDRFDAWKALGDAEERAAMRMHIALVDRYLPDRARQSLLAALKDEEDAEHDDGHVDEEFVEEHRDSLSGTQPHTSVVVESTGSGPSVTRVIADTIDTPLAIHPASTGQASVVHTERQVTGTKASSFESEFVDLAGDLDDRSAQHRSPAVSAEPQGPAVGVEANDLLGLYLTAEKMAESASNKKASREEELELKVAQLQKEAASLQAEKTQQATEMELQSQRTADLQKEVASLQAAKTQQAAQMELHSQRAVDLQKEVAALQTQKLQRDNEVERQARLVAGIQKELVLAKEQESQHNNEMERQSRLIASLRRELAAPQTQGRHGDVRTDEEAQVTELHEEVQALRAQLSQKAATRVEEQVSVMLVVVQDESLKEQQEQNLLKVREMSESRTCMQGIHRQLELELATERSIANKLRESVTSLQSELQTVTSQMEAEVEGRRCAEQAQDGAAEHLEEARTKLAEAEQQTEETKQLLEKESSKYKEEAVRMRDELSTQLEAEKQKWIESQLTERKKLETALLAKSNAERALGQETMEDMRVEMLRMQKQLDSEQLEMKRMLDGERSEMREREEDLRKTKQDLEQRMAEVEDQRKQTKQEHQRLQDELEALAEAQRPQLPALQLRDDWALTSPAGEAPPPRYGHASAIAQTEEGPIMIILGGRYNSKAAHDLYLLHVHSLRWLSAATSLGAAHHAPNASSSGSVLNVNESDMPPPYWFQGHCALALPPTAHIGSPEVGVDYEGLKTWHQTKGWCSLGGEPLQHALNKGLVLVLGNTPPTSEESSGGGLGAVLRQGLGLKAFGGSSKAVAGAMEVYALHMDTLEWRKLETRGAAGASRAADVGAGAGASGDQGPCRRSGHTATLIGGKVWVFGGEDMGQRALNDLHVLDLTTLHWSCPAASNAAPCARAGHTAVAYDERYLLVFGGSWGGSAQRCLDDLHALDTWSMQWFQPLTAGPIPPPRAGHAGALLGRHWYILGGGDTMRALQDMSVLTLEGDPATEVLQWTEVRQPAGAAPAGEGLSAVAVAPDGDVAQCLMTFGGYDGQCSGDVQVYTPGPMLDVAEALREVREEVEGAPAAVQQGLAARLAERLVPAREHPALDPAATTPLLAEARQDAAALAVTAQEAAQQAAVAAIVSAAQDPKAGEDEEDVEIEAHRSGITAAVEMAGAMAAATRIRCSAELIASLQQKTLAEYDCQQALEQAKADRQVADSLRDQVAGLQKSLEKMEELEDKLKELDSLKLAQHAEPDIGNIWKSVFPAS